MGESGQTIVPDTTITGTDGTVPSTPAPSIENYYIDSQKLPQLPAYVAGKNQEITYTYDNQAAITYSVVDDTTGKTLLAPTIFAGGTLGTAVNNPANQAKLNQIEQTYQTGDYVGYNLSEVDNAALLAPTTAQGYTITLHLTHKMMTKTVAGSEAQSPIPDKTVTQTVHYTGAGSDTPADDVQKFTFKATVTQTIDEVTGKVISESVPSWTAAKDSQAVSVPILKGYTASDSEIASSTYTEDAQDKAITVSYKAKPVKVTVKYLRQGTTDSVDKTQTYTFTYGQAWSVSPIAAPDGYYYDTADTTDAQSGTVDFESKTLVMYYAPTEKNLTVNYVDEQGEQIADSAHFKVNYLDAYTTQANDLDDEYSLVTSEIPQNADGIVGNNDIAVTYIYRQTKGSWLNLGYGSRAITRLDYHGHIRSNALNYADGQLITLLNVKDGIEVLQDDADGNALSDNSVEAGKTLTLNVSKTDTITIKVNAMGNATLTRKNDSYTMTATVQKGNWINNTKVYNGKALIETDDFAANGVNGLLTKQDSMQMIDGSYQVTSDKILKKEANLALNTTVDDAPPTEYDTSLNGAEDSNTQNIPANTTTESSPTAQSSSTNAAASGMSIKSVLQSLLGTQEVHADDVTAQSTSESSTSDNNTTNNDNTISQNPSDDTMAVNRDTFGVSLIGSATLPDSRAAFDKAGATGDCDDQNTTNANFTGDYQVTASQEGKVIKAQTLPENQEMDLEVQATPTATLFNPQPKSQAATIVAQPQNGGLALGQANPNGTVTPLQGGQLPTTGEDKLISGLLAAVGAAIIGFIVFVFLKRRKDDKEEMHA